MSKENCRTGDKAINEKWLDKSLKKRPEANISYCCICNNKTFTKYKYCPDCGTEMLEGLEQSLFRVVSI